MNEILTAKQLSKSFGKHEILHEIHFSMRKGGIYGLCGKNGAGKTTFLRLISGLMKPTKGSVRLQTEKPFLGYMPQSCRFDDNRTVKDTILFFTALRQADAATSLSFAKKISLDPSKKVKYLSPGQQKKLQMILAMAGEPDLYILDEPTAGLDPDAGYEMKSIIKQLQQEGKSLLISSHILQDLSELCTDLAILEDGRLIYNEAIDPHTNVSNLVQKQLHIESRCVHEM